MNKYIRTKEGIYELKKDREIVEGWDIAGNPHLVEYEYDQYSGESDEYDLGVYISQADTIDELCDRFVTVVNDKGKVYHFTDYTFENVKNDRDNEVFGAIWTDKGLIYVAKMNDKGDLELI